MKVVDVNRTRKYKPKYMQVIYSMCSRENFVNTAFLLINPIIADNCNDPYLE